MQSIWKGAIAFGLVSIPIQLYAATEERGVSLRQVHAKDGGRVRYQRVCTVDGEEIGYGEVAKGYELPNGEVVVLTDEDFAQLPLSTSRAIDVLSFVDADTIDPIQLSRCYYCDPTGGDVKPYVLLHDALRRTGKVGVVKVALRQRESLAILRPRDGVIILQLLLWPDEVREPQFSFLDSDVTLRPQEQQMAESYVETLTDDLEPEEMVDRYRVALSELVEAKVAGRQVELPPAPAAGGGAVDLMEALRRSVEEAQRTRGAPASTPRKTAKKTATQPAKRSAQPAKKAVAKKAVAKKAAVRKTAATKATNKKVTAKKTAR